MAKLEGVKTLDMVNGKITKVAYGGAEYERVEGEAQTGDLLLMREVVPDTTQGAFYYACSTEGRFAMIVDDAGDLHDLLRGNYELFRKVSAATTPSVEERVAKAEGEIESLKSDVAALKGEAEYKRIGKSEAQAGDYVKFIETDDSSLTVGKMYVIKEIDYDGDPLITDDDDDENWAGTGEEFEIYRKVNAASVEAEPKPERLKVGDYAKVVGGESDCAEINDIVQVMVDDDSTLPFRCDDLSGKSVGWFYEGELVRATDEEVAEAKRAAAEATERKKWAKIGREVGEYKVGDVVAYDDLEWFGNSGIGEVVDFAVEGSPRVWAVDYRGLKSSYALKTANLKLITPVEARFDR